MNPITKRYVALALAACLWAVETWLLIDAAGYTLTPQVAVVPAATAALAALPLFFKDASLPLRAVIAVAVLFFAAHIFQAVVDRTGNALDTKVASAQVATEGRRLLESELARERARLADAEDNVKYESRRGGCKSTCETWRSTVAGIQSRIDRLNTELATPVPVVVADSVSNRISEMSFGFFSEHGIRNWRPVFQPIAFLLGIWAFFGLAFRETVSTVPVSTVSTPETGGGGKSFRRGIRLVDGTYVPDHELQALNAALAGGRKLTNDELAEKMGVGKAESSKRVAKAQALGLVSKVRTGRHVAISLHAH